MNFSNKFKVWWWAILLGILTLVSIWRIGINSHTGVDTFLFVFWFILVLFPIITEISLFGINVKKDIEEAKREIKNSIADIKNHINFQPTINVTTSKADPKEYEDKAKKEINEDIKEESKKQKKKSRSYRWDENIEETKATKNPNVQERLVKIVNIEKKISESLKLEFGERFAPQIKITDSQSENSVIVDGAIYQEDRNVAKIIEIKFITKMSFDEFYYIAMRHLKKFFKLGLRIPVEFIIVSEDMDEASAKIIREHFTKINFHRSLGNNLPHVDVRTFLFKDGNLEEIKTS